MNFIKLTLLACGLQSLLSMPVNAQQPVSAIEKSDQLDLSGVWAFRKDSSDKGVQQQYYKQQLDEKIKLPGSMASNGKGDAITVNTPWTGSIEDSSWFKAAEFSVYRKAGNIKVPFWLQPEKYYKGAAWYQRSITIPASWRGKQIHLFIERAHWETTAWIDNKQVGKQNSLSTPHIYDLTQGLVPGTHRLTIRVDNRVNKINVGQNSHSITDHTQTNWNGMVGAIYLAARPQVFIQDIQVYPDVKKKQVLTRLEICNTTGKPVSVLLDLSAGFQNPDAKQHAPALRITRLVGKNSMITAVYPMGKRPLLWSATSPNLYKLNVQLSAGKSINDQKSVNFGMRSFSTRGTQFTINGQLTFLRGTLECAVFPKTGFPPTDMASWVHNFKVCKAYGLNHLRFHSWCPPEAAFLAADSLGLYLQIECSSWANQGATIGDGLALDPYIYAESKRIVKAYGNHPSFCMMAYGNEPAGKNHIKYLSDFVSYWQKKDPRRLYTTGSGWPVIDSSDYNSTPDPRIQHWGEGLKSILNAEAPKNDYDWSTIIAKWHHPTVSHEIGEWCVYPDFEEIRKYTGVLKAKNFEIFKDKLEQNGLGSLAKDFLYASGKLQALCYKADIEAALRTKGFGGFQLLGLNDFPGQGTALVGVLDAFWEDKGYIHAPEYAEFCNAVVPLVRMPKMVYLNNEVLSARVEIAQFSAAVLAHVQPLWFIRNEKGRILFQGKLARTTIPIGNGIRLGEIKQSLSTVSKASRLRLTVEVSGHQNSWDLFVYPSVLPETPSLLVTQKLDKNAIQTLLDGGKVLLTLKKGSITADKGGDVAVGFSSIFWNTAWTHKQAPVTLGILCNPDHPAFRQFPTQAFSNWQWWDALSHADVIMLDSVSRNLHPLVRVIDDWVTARSLALIFECKVGKGRLVVSGADLLTDQGNRPEARQLLYSLKAYMNTNEFNPSTEVSVKKLLSLIK